MQQITTAWNGIPVVAVTGLKVTGAKMTTRTCCECGGSMKKAEGWVTIESTMRNIHFACASTPAPVAVPAVDPILEAMKSEVAKDFYRSGLDPIFAVLNSSGNAGMKPHTNEAFEPLEPAPICEDCGTAEATTCWMALCEPCDTKQTIDGDHYALHFSVRA